MREKKHKPSTRDSDYLIIEENGDYGELVTRLRSYTQSTVVPLIPPIPLFLHGTNSYEVKLHPALVNALKCF